MPSDLAQRIRDARAARNISFDEAERATKIRRKYLEAIEAGDFAQLPDGPPSRGFIKNYARYLGLDPQKSLSNFEAEVGVPVVQLRDPVPPPPERTRAVSKLTQVAMPDVRWRGAMPDDDADLDVMAEGDAGSADGEALNADGMALAPLDGTTGKAVVIKPRSVLRATGSSFRLKKLKGPFEQYDPNMLTRRGSTRAPFSSLNPSAASRYAPYVLGAIVTLAFIGLMGFVVLPRAGEALSTIQLPQLSSAPTSASEDQPVIAVTIFATQPSEQSQSVVVTPGAPTVIGTADPAQPVQPLPGGGLQLALDARERAWVRVRVDGNVVFEGILPIGPSTPFSAQQDVQVETGNAGAFDVILNNVRVGPLGVRNETVLKTYDASGGQ
jgi:transcriptional regulator with XRE-family HTH domain